MARHTCEARVYPTGSTGYIPWLCYAAEGESCVQPAVDYREYDGRKVWYCVKHWDTLEYYRHLNEIGGYEEVEVDDDDEVGQVLS